MSADAVFWTIVSFIFVHRGEITFIDQQSGFVWHTIDSDCFKFSTGCFRGAEKNRLVFQNTSEIESRKDGKLVVYGYTVTVYFVVMYYRLTT